MDEQRPKDDERRQHPRLPLEVWVEEVAEDAVYFQRSADLGPGGLHLAGTIPHPEGTEVTIRFTLPGERDQIEARGVVTPGAREAGGTGMGIRFTEVDAAVIARIEALIAERD